MTLSPYQFGSTPVYTGPGLAGVRANPNGNANPSWREVSLAERRTAEAAKEPGAKWGFDTALVPVSQLVKYREFDRSARPKFSSQDSEATINSIANDLRKGGVNALESPLSMTYDHKNKWGYIAEGNHRLEAAIRAGITHLPVAVGGNHSDLSEHKRSGIGAPLHLDNRMVEPGGYFPSYQHPGNFKEFEGAR